MQYAWPSNMWGGSVRAIGTSHTEWRHGWVHCSHLSQRRHCHSRILSCDNKHCQHKKGHRQNLSHPEITLTILMCIFRLSFLWVFYTVRWYIQRFPSPSLSFLLWLALGVGITIKECLVKYQILESWLCIHRRLVFSVTWVEKIHPQCGWWHPAGWDPDRVWRKPFSLSPLFGRQGDSLLPASDIWSLASDFCG